MPNLPLRVAVIGVGHMGRNHARIYRQLESAGLCQLVAVVDARSEHAANVAGEFGVEALAQASELIGRVDAVSIAVPTVYHLATAEPLLRVGVACLVEKPLAESSQAAKQMVHIARDSGSILTVGHIERFNPVVQAIKTRGIRPKFVEAHRISPFSFRSADVSVVLDMMIHDIDVVLNLIGQEPEKVDAAGVAVIGKHEDVANARLTFPDGSVANLTASRLAIKTERKIRCFAPDAYVSLDYQKKTGISITKSANIDLLEKVRQLAGPEGDLGSLASLGMDYTKLVQVDPLQPEAKDQLLLELERFLQCVRDGASPEVSGEDGVAAVRTAERIIASCRERPWTPDI